MAHVTLDWLPKAGAFREQYKAARGLEGQAAIDAVAALSRLDLDFVQTGAVDRLITSLRDTAGEWPGSGQPLRLAILSSSTTEHLHAALRVAALRHRVRIEIYQCDYGQYRQELLDGSSPLHAFHPDIALIAFDAHHLVASAGLDGEAEASEAPVERALAQLGTIWQLARERLGAVVLQQAALPLYPELLGENEHRLASSPAWFLDRFNVALRHHAAAAGVHVVSVDRHARRAGLAAWHDPAMWHRAKQEVSLHAAPFYGDLVARILGALRGLSSKVLVLDLDNTIWGGVIGDDGLDGIVLGQGSAAGEAFAGVQRYAAALGSRGIILAVCSKNDESVALRAFDEHPEMVLRRGHIVSFVANWDDKATNLRRIAREVNVGLDSLVFVDDNPFERNLVRGELPMVSVPEVPEDPALVPGCLAAAGYFEALSITADDRARLAQYKANRERQEMAETATDLDSYLRSLEMRLRVNRFGPVDLARTVQLVNKTNQFNLTTRRITDDEARAVMDDPRALGLTFRLADRFGDNGLIAVVIGRPEGDDDKALRLDNWLMSCRVLGRNVEEATLAVVAAQARALGYAALVGEFIPTAKNAMVREHYDRLGFVRIAEQPDGSVRYRMALDTLPQAHPSIVLEEALP